MRYCFTLMLVSCFWLPFFCIEFTPSSRSSNGNLIGLIVGISIGVGGILSVFIVFYIIRKRKRLQTNHNEEGEPEIMLHIYGSCWTSFNLVYELKLLNFFPILLIYLVSWPLSAARCVSYITLHIQLQFNFTYAYKLQLHRGFYTKASSTMSGNNKNHMPICTCTHTCISWKSKEKHELLHQWSPIFNPTTF